MGGREAERQRREASKERRNATHASQHKTSRTTVNVPEAYRDARFNPEVDKRTGFVTRNILCMALKNQVGDIIGIGQAVNKKVGAFSEEDESLFGALLGQVTVAVENCKAKNNSEQAIKETRTALEHATAELEAERERAQKSLKDEIKSKMLLKMSKAFLEKDELSGLIQTVITQVEVSLLRVGARALSISVCCFSIPTQPHLLPLPTGPPRRRPGHTLHRRPRKERDLVKSCWRGFQGDPLSQWRGTRWLRRGEERVHQHP